MAGDFFKTRSQTKGYLEAWIQVLTRINYSDTGVCVQSNRIVYRRGETVHTYKRWERTLGWSRYYTRHSFETLFRSGIMGAIENPAGITLLRATGYDLWTGYKKAITTRDSHATEDFADLQDPYHRVTQKDKINIVCARKEWKKLTVMERRPTLENAEEYYTYQKGICSCEQAATYLEDKAFLNEYEFQKPPRITWISTDCKVILLIFKV